MASNTSKDREARTRLRGYHARQWMHDRAIARRRRDNLLASITIVVVIALVILAEVLYIQGHSDADSSADPGDPSASATPDAASDDPAGDATDDGVPSSNIAENRTWTGVLTVNDVDLGVSLDGAAAPQAVSSTVNLVRTGFYDGTGCHRLTTEGLFVLQCGDPNGDGTGGPDYRYGPIENAPADDVYPTGTIAMAREGGNATSQGSQFFIVYDDTTLSTDEAGGYTVIGSVTSGLDELIASIVDAGTVDGNPDGRPAVPTTITGFTLE